jgi:HEPN domain-containing protein
MDSYQIWLERAKSSLILAGVKNKKGIFYEDLCFQAQQAVEKGLKSLLVFYGIEPEHTHNIANLVQELEKQAKVPASVKNAVILNDYAVQTRYPGDYVPVKYKEYKKVLQTAKEVLKWVEYKIWSTTKMG